MGHVLGKEHSNDSMDIMYPEFKKIYSFDVKLGFEDNFATDGKKRGIEYRNIIGECSKLLRAKQQGYLLD